MIESASWFALSTMGAGVVVPEKGVTMAEAKELVPEGHWQVGFEVRFASSTAEPKESATLSKHVVLEAWAKAERRRERFEGGGCVAANRFREYECPETGGKYCVDRATGASRWRGDGDGDDDEAGPPVFAREQCPETGHFFYHNKAAGLSHWETPRWEHHAPAEAREPAAEEVWREEFDDYHQQAYYLNTATGETRWTRPSGGESLLEEVGE